MHGTDGSMTNALQSWNSASLKGKTPVERGLLRDQLGCGFRREIGPF